MKQDEIKKFIQDINEKLKQDENFTKFFKSIGKDGLFTEVRPINGCFYTITSGCDDMLHFRIINTPEPDTVVYGITIDMSYMARKQLTHGDPKEKQGNVLPYAKSFLNIYKEDIFSFYEGNYNDLKELVKIINNNESGGYKKYGVTYTFNNNYTGKCCYNSNPYEYNKLVNEIVYNITGALLGIYKTIYYNK